MIKVIKIKDADTNEIIEITYVEKPVEVIECPTITVVTKNGKRPGEPTIIELDEIVVLPARK